MKVYVCENPACTLGSRVSPGRFTDGITEQQVFMLTGDEEAPFGEGYCPNCGEQGTEVDEEEVEDNG